VPHFEVVAGSLEAIVQKAILSADINVQQVFAMTIENEPSPCWHTYPVQDETEDTDAKPNAVAFIIAHNVQVPMQAQLILLHTVYTREQHLHCHWMQNVEGYDS
jgi:hypothetical protein